LRGDLKKGLHFRDVRELIECLLMPAAARPMAATPATAKPVPA
jgi:hypothetical protein